ncbi:MAG: tRNA (adenosine(37)-N6)-dimethylallyltransferase MiaA [bacterium TMED198]|nr:MAG: tRNA (adenosine(37)-N6)-dimethylallyltransferase MiaA [bacterium TMED198]
MLNLLIVIIGPTASGKTNLAVKLADRYDSEIISADSRQVYRGLDIGTGKDLHEYNLENKSINYHLIDIISPQNKYSVFEFQNDFKQIYKNIIRNKKVPIVCGGTGFYIKSILCNYTFSSIPPNEIIRNELKNKSNNELFNILKDYYPNRDFSYDEIQTKRRLIRLIEIYNYQNPDIVHNQEYIDNYLVIGLKHTRDSIKDRINLRLNSRLELGLIDEVESLLNTIGYDRLFELGLEYRYVSLYLKGEISFDDMLEKLQTAIHQYSKKQMTFFRYMEKNKIKINWIEKNFFQSSVEIIDNFFSEIENRKI